MTPYSEYIFKSRYARYLEKEGRREDWDESVNRVKDFWLNRVPKKAHEEVNQAMEAVRRMDVMPSMRIMMTAGPALEEHQVAGYNCSYTPIDHPRKFSEVLYILMCGTGVGFSVERDYVKKLPEVPEELHDSDSIIHVRDSKLGWAVAYRELIQMLYGGRVPQWDTSKVRPSGSRLRTFGGRASGPRPLEELFRFTCDTFKNAAGRSLTSIEVHDLICKVAEIVVVGGVRRSALLSLSNLTDDRMRHAKDGQWFIGSGQRALSNNSVAYTVKPDLESYLREITTLYTSKSGERGIFSRTACQEKYGEDHRRDGNHEFGTNPCSEIILRPDEFCNLSEVIVRPKDTIQDLMGKCRHASVLGTLQATLTDFRFLSKKWKNNSEEEALIGVSLTGILDHEVLGNMFDGSLPEILEALRDEVVNVNKNYAKKLGINQAAATTCVKPSGTVSQLCDTASGIHPRYSAYYIRRVKNDNKDPISQFLKDQGVPWEPDERNDDCTIFSFPMEAPNGAITTDELSAQEHLGLWALYNKHWCEHKPSVTIQYREEEFMDLAAYIYKEFDSISGIALLPRFDDIYPQSPYESVDKATYKELAKSMPKSINWEKLKDYENEDNTSVQPELSCTGGGSCEL